MLGAAELNEEIRTTWREGGPVFFLERCFSHITETLSAHLVFSLEVQQDH